MIYDIDEIVLQCVDEETGEVDTEKLSSLVIDNDRKIENIALWIKDLKADVDAIKHEIKRLTARMDAEENKVGSLKAYLQYSLHGQRFKTPRCSITYRKSQVVKIADGVDVNDLPERFKNTIVAVTPKKQEIKEYLKMGGVIDGCTLEEKENMQVK